MPGEAAQTGGLDDAELAHAVGGESGAMGSSSVDGQAGLVVCSPGA